MHSYSNPLDPLGGVGAPGHPMEEVLSLQTYAIADPSAPAAARTEICFNTPICTDTGECAGTGYCPKTDVCSPAHVCSNTTACGAAIVGNG